VGWGHRTTGFSRLPSYQREKMRQALVLLVVGVVQVALFAGLAVAGALDFTDDFDTFDTTRWTRGDHNLGRSYLNPDNVGVRGGNLEIKLPARTLEGGEIRSNYLYGYGSYPARMKLPDAPASTALPAP